MSEQEHQENLRAAQRGGMQNRVAAAKSIKNQIVSALSLREKLSNHWMIMFWAGCFDLVGLIPYLCVLTNFGFALILFLYFGSKRKKGDPSEFTGIVIPEIIGNIADVIIPIFPVNIGTTLYRIILAKE